MNKEQFLGAIRERIGGLPQSDVDRSLDYYSEMIDDHMEEGLSEEEAVAAVGTVDEAVSQIMADIPLPKLVTERLRPKRSLAAWEIVLLVLGSPVWLSLLLAAFTVFLSVYIVLWALVIALYVTVLSLGVVAIAGIVGIVGSALLGNPAQSFLSLGSALVCGGLAVLLFFGSNAAARGAVKLGRSIALWVKSLLIGKGNEG